MNASFHNANFSQRIWTNEAVMKTELDKLLKQGLIQGKGTRELARSLRTLCGVSQRNAERLMITELARVQIEAQKLSYEENDFDEYEYIAEPTACPVCKVMDGKHFKVAKMLPGENAAPMHPHCRCSTAPYSDRKEFDEWLSHLEKGGTAEPWNRLKKKRIDARKRESRFTDRISELNLGQKDIFKLRNIEKNLRKTEVGRRTIDYINQHPEINIEFAYLVSHPDDNCNYKVNGIIFGNNIRIYCSTTKTIQITCEILIHEITHHMLKTDFPTRREECLCEIEAAKHRFNKEELTFGEMRSIVKEVNNAYSELEWR